MGKLSTLPVQNRYPCLLFNFLIPNFFILFYLPSGGTHRLGCPAFVDSNDHPLLGLFRDAARWMAASSSLLAMVVTEDPFGGVSDK